MKREEEERKKTKEFAIFVLFNNAICISNVERKLKKKKIKCKNIRTHEVSHILTKAEEEKKVY